MKVLTIKQPYASLIANGYKEYEFRSWNTKYRGEILIHAGKGINKEAMKRMEYLNLEYPIGKIIAKATITDSILVDEEFSKRIYSKDKNVYKNLENLDRKIYAFKLENVEKIEHIEVNGKLSLWDYDYKD